MLWRSSYPLSSEADTVYRDQTTCQVVAYRRLKQRRIIELASNVLTVAYEVVVVYERFELQSFVGKNLSVLDRSSHMGDGRLHGVVAHRGSTVSTGVGLSWCIYSMNCFSAKWDALTNVLLFQISLLFWNLWSKNSSLFLIDTTAAKTVNLWKLLLVCALRPSVKKRIATILLGHNQTNC